MSGDKFDSPVSELLYEWSMVQGHDEDAGTTGYGGVWYGLFGFTDEDKAELDAALPNDSEVAAAVGAILTVTNLGFVYAELYAELYALNAAWSEIVDMTSA